MLDRERERIGRVVITGERNIDPAAILCASCGKHLARFGVDTSDPSPEELLSAGAVAWPNFGWFCSVACERAYAQASGVSCAERISADAG